MTCRCRITIKIDRFNKLIAVSCITILIPRKLEMPNFCGTAICVFITAKLSSDLTVEIRRTLGHSSKKVPSGITGSSQQDFDFVGKLQKYWPQRRYFKLVGWLIAKTAVQRWYSFFKFPVMDPQFTELYRSINIFWNGQNMLLGWNNL